MSVVVVVSRGRKVQEEVGMAYVVVAWEASVVRVVVTVAVATAVLEDVVKTPRNARQPTSVTEPIVVVYLMQPYTL